LEYRFYVKQLLVTLLLVQSTILHGPPSIITRQRASVIANCYADQEMSVITTYLNDNLKLHLIDFLSICYTSKFATNKSSHGSSALADILVSIVVMYGDYKTDISFAVAQGTLQW